MRIMSATALASLLAACGVRSAATPGAASGATPDATLAAAAALTDELGAPATAYDTITGYVNYYEFSFNKEGVAPLTGDFQTSPWQVEVGGLVEQPMTLTVDDIRALARKRRLAPAGMREACRWSSPGWVGTLVPECSIWCGHARG
jgi:sulfoxide reductase catalytic subunit YedY